MNTTFKPMIIGQADKEKITQVTSLYEQMCYEATSLKSNLQMMFAEDEEKISNEFLSELLNSDPEKFIRTKWVEHKKISLPGLDIKKLIASDLLDIPKYDEIIEIVGHLTGIISEVKTLKFNFPLEKFSNDDGYFGLNEDFYNQLHEAEIVYTENEQQNRVLEAVTELKDAINKICNLGLIPARNLSLISFKFDRYVLKRTGNSADPFELNPTMFRTTLRNLPQVK